MKMRLLIGLGLLTSGLLLAAPSHAAVTLKGGRDSEFRVKTIKARTVIENGIATTVLVWTFADNARYWKPEVEFLFSTPQQGVVTFFAYWFEGKRVVARVVEKNRAGGIYAQLTEWGTDPALVNIDRNNNFRASIFPIRQGQDVQVEMHIVQPLEATATGQRLVLPLSQKVRAKHRLSKWLPVQKAESYSYQKVQVDVETRLKGVSNFPQAKYAAGKWHFDANALDTEHDFILDFPVKPVPLQTNLYSSRASGSQGYFSLLLTPQQALKNPQLKISGIRTYDVLPAKIPAIAKGKNILICGRYSGAGQATVSLADGTTNLSSRVRFSGQRGADNPAAKLWASRKIAALGDNEAHFKEVVALSKRWNLPSAQTSWLAVPESEKRNFEWAKRSGEISQLKREIAGDLMMGDTASAETKKKKLAALYSNQETSQPRDLWLSDTVGDGLNFWADSLASSYAAEQMEAQPDPKRLALLESNLAKSVDIANDWNSKNPNSRRYGRTLAVPELLKEAKRNVLYNRQDKVATDYAETVLNDGPDSPYAIKLRKRLEELQKLTNTINFGQDIISRRTSVDLHQLAYQKLREERRLNPDKVKIAEIESDMKRIMMLNRWFKNDNYLKERANDYLEWQEYSANRDAVDELLVQYRQEVEKAVPNETRLDQLYAQIGYVVANWPVEDWYPVQRIKERPNPLDAQLIQKARETGRKRDLVEAIDKERQEFVRPGDPLIAVLAPANCRQVIAILPSGEIKKLVYNAATKQWEARFDVPAHAAEGDFQIQVLIVSSEGTRHKFTMNFGVDTVAPTATAALKNDGSTWNLSLATDELTDRVSAFTPWNSRVELKRGDDNRFAAEVEVPAEYRERKAVVRFVVTDKAHNRSEILVDWN